MAPMAAQAPLKKGERRPIAWSNIAVGGVMNMFEVTTLGQPLEVVKTQMASARTDTMGQALRKVWGRGGVLGFYQGLIPWAWIEASTKGAVLLFTAAEIEGFAVNSGISPGAAGLLGGMGGGVAQAYATMGFCTCMKTAEITRSKLAAGGVKPPSTFKLFGDMWREGGIRGINKGVNAVALRQMTNWGSRMGFARLAEQSIRKARGVPESERLGAMDRIAASTIGGALGCWNQPIEVVRVEMQSMAKGKSVDRPGKATVLNTLSYIYKENGLKGLYRGVTPRIGLGIWQTVCMVSFADVVKEWIAGRK
ncbi:BZ3500_MvSof-1268-A1-R1_Chr1-3g02204 [Microbotryum saponariae]|uniref:BZ3500_MvSof-1268-A1-R1_Chr1-3g02204 protein n=1 Tax=Microbotryum saponariae TaxID=289078 RepID=A0A2X0KRU4_9BASI|nr:BZ3500_MvSof-1268-A1-R1_Chr1-3g02204 [Microbotryum saponariae]SCZ95647.1 BZ3501_MvSof-1269-A2-R1_Chr1-3g01807 [Microbotryum saponariae]